MRPKSSRNYHYRRAVKSTPKAQSLAERLQPLQQFIRHFRWIHMGLGLMGNAFFFIGSIFFLWESTKTAGVWLFIIGSLGMLIDSIGSAVLKLEK